MGNSSLETQENTASCGDWVPPPELQAIWQHSPPPMAAPDKQKLLATIIENDVIPRLLLANRPELAIAPPAADPIAAKLAERVGTFSELVIHDENSDAVTYFETLRTEGASIEALFQDLLAPTARRLGELWDEDINDFLDVTRGIGQLQKIVRTYSSEFCDEIRQPLSSYRALLMPLPGNHHTFGVSLLREHFLREGWRVWCGPCSSNEDIVTLVQRQWFEMVGVSASHLADPGSLAKLIAQVRKTSVNKDIRVFVGGYAFDEAPSLVGKVGADATASDGRQAVEAISKMIVRRL